MSRWQGISVEAEGTGVSRPLSEQVNLLGSLLGEAIKHRAGEDTLTLIEELRQQCKAAVQQRDPSLRDAAAERIRDLSHRQIEWLLKAFTTFFHLVNQAERQEIIRINRERARSSDADAPRSDSIDEAVATLKEQGLDLQSILHHIHRLDVQPTLTAHPTEARRRSILYKQQHLSGLMDALQGDTLPPLRRMETLTDMFSQISLLLSTDHIRAARPTVEEEVDQGLYFMRNAIWDTVPTVQRDIRQSLERQFGVEAAREATDALPPLLRFRSWIGSDRDGNPNVTPAITRATFRRQRLVVLERYFEDIKALRRELSISDEQVDIPQALYDSIEADAAHLSIADYRKRQFQQEPFRMKLTYMRARLSALLRENQSAEAPPYTSRSFIEDLKLIRDTLTACGFEDLAAFGQLADLLSRAQTFGFHLAALDVRQHSEVHEQTVAHLLRAAGLTDDYAGLPEEERLALLTEELQNPRPLLPRGRPWPEATASLMETLELLVEQAAHEPASVGTYIVSMTHEVSDLLEVLLLAKEVGLWRLEDGTVTSPLDLAPLFETVEDLAHADAFMEELFAHPLYRQHLHHRGDFQELMLGYSDSNKDGGYWMANWALHRAQGRLSEVCRAHDIDFRFFHGRGGTVGRGGGRASQGILAMPEPVHNGRIRFTEQGEVISFRYALSAIARRHLEQIFNAMLRASAGAVERPFEQEEVTQATAHRIVDAMADTAMDAYRALIHDDDFWPWYVKITPIQHISRLPIASRPVSRGSGEVDFDGLRAIPWGFAWTQTRYLIPGWYGTGVALQEAMETHGAETLQTLYAAWPFFQAVVDSAQREMSRARLIIAQRYAGQDTSTATDDGFHGRIEAEYDRARSAILTVTKQDTLLENSPVIKKSIALRNPYTDVLNLLQLDLLRRYREEEGDPDATAHALLLSINGIAAAMQSTG